MALLSLAFLGQPEVRQAGTPVAFRTRKALALLIYLVVEGRPQTRDQLALLFWPESDSARGRMMLRTSLAHLRHALSNESLAQNYILVEGNQLEFNSHVDYDLDLQTLTTASNALTVGSVASERRTVLEMVVERYRGDFLAGFSLSDAPEFDTWASQQREAWHHRFGSVLNELSQLQSESGDLPAALATAARWVKHDSVDEVAYRRLMQLHFANGDRADALRTFETARQTLARELGVELGPETLALAQRLQHQDLKPATHPVTKSEPLAASTLMTLPMVGRANELADLIAISYKVRHGSVHVVSLEGEAGIGKTRLAVEFLNWTAADGLDTWQGRAFETGGHLPYQPIVAMLRECIERENAPEDLVGDVWLAELSRLLPELRERYPDLPQPVNTSEAEAQSRLFEAVAHWGLATAKRRALVVFIDDIQWADPASLDLLNYVIRRWAEAAISILVMLTLRSESQAALAAWLADLSRSLPVMHLSLSALTIDHTQQLVQSLGLDQSQQSLLAQFSQWLFAETEGQPFFLTELLKTLVERGLLESSLAAGGGPAALPSSVRDLVSTRLARLTPAAADLLAAGALLGQTAEFETLCQVAGVAENDGLRALDELLVGRWLAEMSMAVGEPARYVFAHDKIRDVVYTEAGEARRRVFHRRALAVLESRAAPPATLAHHALAGGLAERAFQLSLAAGDEALRLYAVVDAIKHFDVAEQLLAGPVRGATAEVQYHLYLQLGRAHELNNDRPVARMVYERMLPAARTVRHGPMECAALNRLATLASQEADYPRAFELLYAAQRVAETSGDKEGLVETEWALAQLGIYGLDAPAALQHGLRALALARETDNSELIARCLNVVTFAEKGLAKTETVFEHGREAAARYAALGNAALQSDSLMLVADALILNGEVGEGLKLSHDCLALCEQIGNKWGQGNCLLHIARGLAYSGQYSPALAAAERALVVSSETPYVPLLTQAILGAIYRSILNLSEAYRIHTALMDRALSLALPSGFQAMIAAELCADCVAAERWDEALAFARQASAHRNYDVLPGGHLLWPETLVLTRAGEVALAQADIEAFKGSQANFRQYQVSYLWASGILAQAQGDEAQAQAHWGSATTLAHTIGLVDQLWLLHLRLDETERALAIVRPLVAALAAPALRETFTANLASQCHLVV